MAINDAVYGAMAVKLLMAAAAAFILRIASNSIKVEVYKLEVSNVKYR